MLPSLQGVRLSEQNGSIRVSGRNLVPVEVAPEELPQLEAVHLGQTADRLALAVKDLGDHGFTVLQMRTAMEGAPVDRIALYRFATGTRRHGRLAVRPPHQRQPIDIRSAETVRALAFFQASGADFGLSDAPLAEGLKTLQNQDFRFHREGLAEESLSPFKAYAQIVEQGQKLLWVSREDGPRVPFAPHAAQNPSELADRYELARQIELPENLGPRERAALWEHGYAGRDPETRLRCLARLSEVAPLPEAGKHYDALLASFEPDQAVAAAATFVGLARRHGTLLAAEALPLIALPVENETLQDRSDLLSEILDGPAGSPGATAVDRRVDYVRGALERFAESDPAGARARLSSLLALERDRPEPARAIGHNEGRLVIGGVVVKGKR